MPLLSKLVGLGMAAAPQALLLVKVSGRTHTSNSLTRPSTAAGEQLQEAGSLQSAAWQDSCLAVPCLTQVLQWASALTAAQPIVLLTEASAHQVRPPRHLMNVLCFSSHFCGLTVQQLCAAFWRRLICSCTPSASLQVLSQLQTSVQQRLASADSLAKLLGVTGHLARRAPLPTHHLAPDSADYVVEWLDLSVHP